MTDNTRNRMGNCKNPYQGNAKKVLCVCSAGLLRSPTAARVLAEEYGFNTRACGVYKEFALIPLDPVLILWADEVVVMDAYHQTAVEALIIEHKITPPTIVNLDVEDNHEYMAPELVREIKNKYAAYLLKE